jgi:hypothetical protein
MLRLMLAHHPSISGAGETDFLFDYLHPHGSTWRYDLERLVQERIYRASPVRIPEDTDGVEALDQMIAQIRREPGCHSLLVLHRHAKKALALLPGAKIIHLLRDPRDVARSVMGMGWAGNVYHGCESWMKTEDEWEDAKRQHQPVVHEVRFEELVAQPKATLVSISNFLGVDYDEAMLAYDAKSTYTKPDVTLTFQWKRKLTDRDIRRVEARLGRRLQVTGYTPSGLPQLHVSMIERLWLRMQNYASVKRRLINRYGLWNVLQRKVARMIGLRHMEAKASARICRITLEHLK